MPISTEAELVQNSAIGAALLWAFTKEYFGQTRREKGPTFPLALPILPMTLHQETVESLCGRNYDGGLDLALAENRTLTLDLQERMEAMVPQTMSALGVAFASRLITFDRDSGQLRPLRMTDPFHADSDEVRRMLHTATRLGYWFATINHERIGSLLRIRF